MFDKKVFGERLFLLRKKKGVTQTDVGDLLGITQTQVGDMERGNSATTMARLYLLCDYFNVSADYLLGRADTP